MAFIEEDKAKRSHEASKMHKEEKDKGGRGDRDTNGPNRHEGCVKGSKNG